MTNIGTTYYFINDFNQICRQKTGVDEEFSEILDLQNLLNDINKITKENEQLKERNQRQAKHLAELYELMAKKDWEALTEIIDDFCSCEG